MGEILRDLEKMIKPGMTGLEIDQKAESMILDAGGVPAFKGYRGRKSDPPFPTTICFSMNQELVHGIASADKIIKDGDLVSIDIGMRWPVTGHKTSDQKYDGYFTDTALTVSVGKVSAEDKKLLLVTKQALEIGIKTCQSGNTVGDIGKAIQAYVESQGNYGIVRDLVGHGVGHAVHEDPRVPNYYDKSLDKWILRPGVVIAIEPMIALGHHSVEVGFDGWTIEMADKSRCAHFEHTIVITKDGPIVATRRPGEKIIV